jgi:hypothetical protein
MAQNARKNQARKRNINRKMFAQLSTSVNNGCLLPNPNEDELSHSKRVRRIHAQLAGHARNS